MKYILIVGDGMADEPLVELAGLTPLQYARTPAIDALARAGTCGLLHTVPAGCAPGSEIAILSLLGYDPTRVFEGRGVLEAVGARVALQVGDLVLRCNLVSLDDAGRLQSYNAGGIAKAEGEELIAFLQEHVGSDSLQFHPGLAYRHTLVCKGGDKALQCIPPQDVQGRFAAEFPIEASHPGAEATARQLNDLIQTASSLLSGHPVNRRRRAQGRPAVNGVWCWSPGCMPRMESLGAKYGFSGGAVVAGVPLVRGIGACAGLRMIDVPGATGYWDTDYNGKAEAAIEALKTDDFVLLHVEAPDECSHEGDFVRKIQSIENLDAQVVEPLMQALQKGAEPFAIALLPDHPTLCRTRAHTDAPVPFVLCGTRFEADRTMCYDEFSAREGACGTLCGDAFIRLFFTGSH